LDYWFVIDHAHDTGKKQRGQVFILDKKPEGGIAKIEKKENVSRVTRLFWQI